MVETCKELGVSFEQTVARLKLRFDISEQEAQEKARSEERRVGKECRL